MNIQRWIAQRRPDWQRLEGILTTIETQPLTALPREDLQTFGGLYRQVSADLAKAQLRGMGADLTGYLQALTLRAHNQVYQPPVTPFLTVMGGYIRAIPVAIRRLWRYGAVSFGIFALGMLVGALLYLMDSNFIETLLPADAITGVEEKGQLWTGSMASVAPLASSFILSNNIAVALMAFAGGMVFGLGTVYILFTNGVMLGGIGLFIADYGLSIKFWAFVSAHGVPELSAIFLAGAAGLMLGKALLMPAPYSRRDALVIAAREAVPLIVCVVVLLILAGIIEGFFSPNDTIAPVIKYGVGLIEMALLGSYLSFVGREPKKLL